MDIFRIIAERKIQEAIENGEFDDLPKKGISVEFDDDTWLPQDLRYAYRILKNSGHLPPELELRKEITSLRDLINTIDDDAERLKRLRELNFKIMKLNLMRDRPLSLDQECRIIEGLLKNDGREKLKDGR